MNNRREKQNLNIFFMMSLSSSVDTTNKSFGKTRLGIWIKVWLETQQKWFKTFAFTQLMEVQNTLKWTIL